MNARTNRRKPISNLLCWLGLHHMQRSSRTARSECSRCGATRCQAIPIDSGLVPRPGECWFDSPWPTWGPRSPWVLIDPSAPHTYPPDLRDVLVAYPPDDAEDAPYIELAYRNDGHWFITGDGSSRVIRGYQNPLCWLDPADLPPLPESLGLGLPSREAST